MSYRVYIDGDGPDCPHDDRFEHRFYFGCVPKTFSERTGRAKGHSQTPTEIDGLPWQVYLWDGGCDKAGVTAANKVAEHQRSLRAGGRSVAEIIGFTGAWEPSDGTILPQPTVDDLLEWLMDQDRMVWFAPRRKDLVAQVRVGRPGSQLQPLFSQAHHAAPTLLAALEAAVRAVAGEDEQ